jgi:trimeric autotransporter adhesin
METGASNTSGSVLHQNSPNPFSTDTEIKMNLPESSRQASISIYNLEGKQLKSVPVNKHAETSIKIPANELDAGMYLYSPIIDGKIVNTKRMPLTK